MMTSSNGNSFRVIGHLCGEFTGPRWIPRTKASDPGFWYFLCSWILKFWILNLDLRPEKQLSKQSWGWWFQTPSHSLWRHRNVDLIICPHHNHRRVSTRDGIHSGSTAELKFTLYITVTCIYIYIYIYICIIEETNVTQVSVMIVRFAIGIRQRLFQEISNSVSIT